MNELVKMYQLTSDKKILEKIIKELDDVINYFLKNNKLNLPDGEIYDYIIEGIIIASRNYSFYGVSFKSYANLCIGRVLIRLNSKIFNENKLFENFLSMLNMMEKKYKITLDSNLDLIDITLEEMATQGLLYPYEYDDAKNLILKMLETRNIYFNTLSLNDEIEKCDAKIDSNYLKRIIMSSLTKQEYDYITSYYGLFGKNEETLETIGKKYNVTAESVRQTKENALKKIGYILSIYNNCNLLNIDKVKEFLKDLLSYQEIDYLCHTFSIFTYSKKNYQELRSLYNEVPSTIEIKVGMIFEKIAFLINHVNTWSKVEFYNLYQLLENKLSKLEFKILKDYYGLFNNSKKTITRISDLYSIDIKYVKSVLKEIKSKLNELFKDSNINKFLSNILTNEEYEVLLNINNIRLNKDIKIILNMIITKINLLYKYQDLNIDKEAIKKYLDNILSHQEYRNICLRYGLFNSPRTIRPLNSLYTLSPFDKKILQKIAISLNIENTKNQSI